MHLRQPIFFQSKHPIVLFCKKHVKTIPIFFFICLLLVVFCLTYLLPKRHAQAAFTGTYEARSNTCAIVSPNRPYTTSNISQSRWKQLPVRYPPGPLIQLPSESPKAISRIQFPFSQPHIVTDVQKQRQAAVKSVFQRCWTSYKEKAWLQDELSPVSGGSNNRFGGWGATLVDSLDTLWILDMKGEFNNAVNAALTIDFIDPTKLQVDTISVFETTIRFLAGFLSAYDLPGCQDKRLLDKAVELGDMLYAAFDTPHRMPINTWNPQKALIGAEQADAPDDGTLATMGSLTMEFTRLSQLTGDMRYFDAVQRITNVLDKQQNDTRLPGMWPQLYDSATVDFSTGSSFSLGAEADSAYEYILKMYLLLGATNSAAQYKRMYELAVDTAMQSLFFRPMNPDNLNVLISGKFMTNPNSSFLLTESEHLACFLGGMVGMGGKILSNSTHVDTAEKLTQGCVWAYKTTPSGIMPENFQTVKCPTPSCDWNETLWQEQGLSSYPKGFTAVRDAAYHLRPEAIESLFYMYRIKGDTQYQDVAWEIFQTIENQTATELGNAELSNVLQGHSAKSDFMQSFWTAEGIKYLYLIFGETDIISLDDFVFNTEAHPFRIPK
jgi:mannosyl-oligosaccharide alpha-1,2-mannosidase